jgi:transcriptional regulator with XRE-family HTH domain
MDEHVEELDPMGEFSKEPMSAKSKGHLSLVENGKANPTLMSLKLLALALNVGLVDIVNNGKKSLRQALIRRSRSLTEEQLGQVLEFIDGKFGPEPPNTPKEQKRTRHRASGTKRKAT